MRECEITAKAPEDGGLAKKQELFPGNIKANPYAIMLYDYQTGWNNEVHIVSVDEARDICWQEIAADKTNNSHGTDVDYTYERTEDMTLEEMADHIQACYSAEKICKQPKSRQENYNRNASVYASKLRMAAAARQTVEQAAQKAIRSWLGEYTPQTLRYAAGNTAVFSGAAPDRKSCIIKLSCVPKGETVLEQISAEQSGFRGMDGMVSIWELRRFPLDDTCDVLVTVMPELDAIQKIKKKENKYFGFWDPYRPSHSRAMRTEQVISLGTQIARSLKAIHEKGYVHNDVKPENILGKKEGSRITWCLADYSSLHRVADRYNGSIQGTSAYMAPELRSKQPFSFSVDVYSWAVTMLALIADRVPEGIMEASVEISRRSPAATWVKYSFGYDRSYREDDGKTIRFFEILKKALAKDPNERYANGGELLEALESMEADLQAHLVQLQKEQEEAKAKEKAAPRPMPQKAALTPPKKLVPAPEQPTKPTSEQPTKPAPAPVQPKEAKADMDPFVGALYDRLDQAGKLKLYLMVQNAINEMHNSGIFAGLDADTQKRIHDPDPQVRVREKTAVAKAVGKTCIRQSAPIPQDGALAYLTVVKYDPRFANAICLCIQGGIEGLYMVGIHQACGSRMVYNVRIEHDAGADVQPLIKLLQELGSLYAEYQITVLNEGAASQNRPTPAAEQKAAQLPRPSQPAQPESKPGFWARLFGRG